MKPLVIYCYDAYCGWSYGFSPVIRQLSETFKDRLDFETLSGGMIPLEYTRPVSATAAYIRQAYRDVEARTGIRFGEDYLWHIQNPADSDWQPHSEKSAIALCILKEYLPEYSVRLAGELQHALFFEGRDLTDDEAYRHILDRYHIPADEFYPKLASADYKEKAHQEFALVKRLQVTGFPAVFLQVVEQKFYLLTHGFTPYDTLVDRLEQALSEAGEAP